MTLRTISFILLGALIDQGAVAAIPTASLEVAAVRIDVLDIAESALFYRDHLGFRIESGERSDGTVRLANGEVPLILRRVSGDRPAARGVRLNLMTGDLDRLVARLETAGGSLEPGPEERSAVGRYRTLIDPSGNRIHLKELFQHELGEDEIRVFNLGIPVREMAAAERFYVEGLGFPVYSRDYDPPVVPLQRKGVAAFILSDREVELREGVFGASAAILLRFAVDDLGQAAAALKSAGHSVIGDQPRPTADGPVLVLRDPDGHQHELIERRSGARTDRSDPLATLDWLAGRWVREEEGAYLEESWSPVVGDSLAGTFRWQRDGRTWLYELMTIEREQEQIVFRLHHFARGMELWEREKSDGPLTYPLLRAGDRQVVFENPECDQPRRFVYRRIGTMLQVRIEGPDGTGDELLFRAATVHAGESRSG